MKIYLILIALISCFLLYGQGDVVFESREIFIRDSTQFKTEQDFVRGSSFIFEDEDYRLRKTCSGEWGGSIWFKNKKTNIEYSCSATCPVVVNKLNGKYIVTATLAHLSGSSEILEIDDPTLLTIYKTPKRSKKIKIIEFDKPTSNTNAAPKRIKRIALCVQRYVGDDESKSKIGSNMLLDSIGVLTLASFPYNGELFHVTTDFKKTFICRIANNRFVTVDTISNESIWTYNPEVIRTNDDHFIVFFKNKDVGGYLDIVDNKINIIRYK